MLKTHSQLWFLLACALGVLAAIAVYLPSLPGEFLFDDIGSIVQNSAVHIRDLGFTSLSQAALSSPSGDLARPLSMLSFALDYYFFGLSPFAFRLTGIVIHVSCGAVLCLVAREMLIAYSDVRHADLTRREIGWLSLGIGVLWCVHPLDLTAVLYIVQRETCLAALFSGLGLLAYLHGRRRQREGRDGRWLIWLCTPLAMLAGLLCKENAALLPVFLLIFEFCLLGFKSRDGKLDRGVLAFFSVFLLLPGLALLTLIVLRPGALFWGYSVRDYTPVQRVLSESRILLDYLRWAALPDLQQLALFHDDIVPSRGLLTPWTTLPSCIVIAALLSAGVLLRRRLPLLSLGILWFFAGHLIESTVLPLELVFEHRNYLPLFGLIFGIAGTLYMLARGQGEARLVAALIVIGIAAMSVATAVRATGWSTELDFARSETQHHPDSPRALAELEWAYLNYIVSTHDTSLVPKAIAAAERSKRADAYSINQDVSLAYMFTELGDMPQARTYLVASAADAGTAHISATLQFSLQTLIQMAVPKNQTLYPDMAGVFHSALANPMLESNASFAANMWNDYSLFQSRTQDIPGSLVSSHKAIVLCPSDSQLQANFARLLLRYGDTKDAKGVLQTLRDMHDLRREAELAELQADYDRLTAAQHRK
ncbi:MAG TPA: hypothetical protein VGN70_07140 [Gammaproteobacteria bacterium]